MCWIPSSIFFVRCFLSLTLPWLFRLIIYIVMSWYKELTFMSFISKEVLDKAICLTITSITSMKVMWMKDMSMKSPEYEYDLKKTFYWWTYWTNMKQYGPFLWLDPSTSPYQDWLDRFSKTSEYKANYYRNSVAPKTIH